MQNHYDEVNAKMQAEKAYYNAQQQCGQAVPAQPPYYGDQATGILGCNQEYRPSPVEQAEKNYVHHSEQAMKSQMAVSFLRTNPAFDEFIKLIRSGAIQI